MIDTTEEETVFIYFHSQYSTAMVARIELNEQFKTEPRKRLLAFTIYEEGHNNEAIIILACMHMLSS